MVLVLAAAGLAGHAVFTLSHITPATKIFTPAELSGYGAGRPAFKYGGRLLLAVLGKVFDVTAGHQHYSKSFCLHVLCVCHDPTSPKP